MMAAWDLLLYGRFDDYIVKSNVTVEISGGGDIEADSVGTREFCRMVLGS